MNLCNETLKRAVVRSLEIIGEATKKILSDFKIKMEFNPMERYGGNERTALIHDYIGINYSKFGMS